MRAFLHLGTLADSDRFAPWFRRIVHNQAVAHLRKRAGTAGAPASAHAGTGEWRGARDLDQLLSALQQRYVDAPPESPPERLARKAFVETLRSLLQQLPPRNRAIFEAYVFEQLSAQEIAAAHGTKTSNVYNILSRSRAKLQDERYRLEILPYVQSRRRAGRLRQALLPPPGRVGTYTSLGVALFGALQYTPAEGMTLTEVMGYSGQAFRITMAHDCGPSSLFTYDWCYAVERAVSVLDFRFECVGRPTGEPPHPDQLVRALELIQSSIDRGIPAIAWNLSSSEFSLIYGYHDDRRTLTFREFAKERNCVPYERLGRTAADPELFIATLRAPEGGAAGWRRGPSDPALGRAALRQALSAIVDHAHGKETAVRGYNHGLAAYETWISALQNGSADPVGHAYGIALLAEARQHAARFLAAVAERTSGGPAAADLAVAAAAFARVQAGFVALYPGFPYGVSLGATRALMAEAALPLRSIQTAEAEGIEALAAAGRLL